MALDFNSKVVQDNIEVISAYFEAKAEGKQAELVIDGKVVLTCNGFDGNGSLDLNSLDENDKSYGFGQKGYDYESTEIAFYELEQGLLNTTPTIKITAKQKEKALQEGVDAFLSLTTQSVKLDEILSEITKEREEKVITEPNGLTLDVNKTPIYHDLNARGDIAIKMLREVNIRIRKMKTLSKLYDNLRYEVGYGLAGYENLNQKRIGIAKRLVELLKSV
jgi:hypothetical protein